MTYQYQEDCWEAFIQWMKDNKHIKSKADLTRKLGYTYRQHFSKRILDGRKTGIFPGPMWKLVLLAELISDFELPPLRDQPQVSQP